jgi:hypothetical protein
MVGAVVSPPYQGERDVQALEQVRQTIQAELD